MATSKAVNAGSVYCRDCGGPVERREGYSWCENTPAGGKQLAPKSDCQNFTMHDRAYCEHCAFPIGGPQVCTQCKRPPTTP